MYEELFHYRRWVNVEIDGSEHEFHATCHVLKRQFQHVMQYEGLPTFRHASSTNAVTHWICRMRPMTRLRSPRDRTPTLGFHLGTSGSMTPLNLPAGMLKLGRASVCRTCSMPRDQSTATLHSQNRKLPNERGRWTSNLLRFVKAQVKEVAKV